MSNHDTSNKSTTEYIAPVSLWLVVRKRFLDGGSLFVEPAWTGCDDHKGPVIFVSRMHAEVYARMRNTYHSANDSGNWKSLPLHEFDLLEHSRALGGKLTCNVAFGFALGRDQSIIVSTGAPRVRYVPLTFSLSTDEDKITFSFNQWVFDFMREEWAALGVPDFEDRFNAVDEMDTLTFKRAAMVSIATASVTRDGSDSGGWGVYDTDREQWLTGTEVGPVLRDVH